MAKFATRKKKMTGKWISVACAVAAFAAHAAVVKEYRRIDGNDASALPGKTIYPDMLADGALWQSPHKDSNYRDLLGMVRDGGKLTLNGTKSTKSKDTAWYVITEKLALGTKGAELYFRQVSWSDGAIPLPVPE